MQPAFLSKSDCCEWEFPEMQREVSRGGEKKYLQKQKTVPFGYGWYALFG